MLIVVLLLILMGSNCYAMLSGYDSDDSVVQEMIEIHERFYSSREVPSQDSSDEDVDALDEISDPSEESVEPGINNYPIAMRMITLCKEASLSKLHLFLRESNNSISTILDEFGRTLAHNAAFCCKDENFIFHIFEQGVDLHIADAFGKKAIDYVEKFGNLVFATVFMVFYIEQMMPCSNLSVRGFVSAAYLAALKTGSEQLALACKSEGLNFIYGKDLSMHQEK